jgi:hypothetical protein
VFQNCDAFCKQFKHEHHFSKFNVSIWNLADKLFFQKHMTQLLIDWNPIVKEFEESNKWKELMAG